MPLRRYGKMLKGRGEWLLVWITSRYESLDRARGRKPGTGKSLDGELLAVP